MPAIEETRRDALRTLLAEAEIDALLVTDLLNIRYLTGFTGSNAALLVDARDEAGAEDRTLLCTDGRYLTQSAAQVPDLAVEIDRASALRLATLAQDAGLRRLGFESQVVTVDEYSALSAHLSDIELRRAGGLVERLREVKDEHEIALLRDACRAADAALAALLAEGGIRRGRTELEVARRLEWLMFEHGADGISFETIVATGANSAVPHHRPTGAVLATGDFVKLDFGALVQGYHSDMTRTVVLGEASTWQREIYDVVARAQAAGRAALSPGVAAADVDAASRAVIAEAGYEELFLHGLGHGVGLQIHEGPGIGANATGTLSSGATVTVEPGVYFAGRGGVRIEDTLVVREQGPELLTLTTKDLVVI